MPARVFTKLYNGYCGNDGLEIEFAYDIAWLRSASAGKMKNISVAGDDYDAASSSKIESLFFSHHQKTVTIDSEIGFCSGMNWRRVDWDTNEHRTEHPLRDFIPRHDVCAQIQGPAVFDLEQNFAERWDKQSGTTKISGTFQLPQPIVNEKANHPAQVVRTYRKSGHFDTLKVYQRAIANAEKYIYIENQFFRSPTIVQSIAQQIGKNPKLELILITLPDEGFLSISRAHTYNAIHTIEKAYEKHRKGRFQAYTLFSSQRIGLFDRISDRLSKVRPDKMRICGGKDEYTPINSHVKIMIIDDLFYTIGSANINDRSMEYDSEININVLHAQEAREFRLRLWSEHLDRPRSELEDVADGVRQFHKVAFDNIKRMEDNQHLKGNVIPLKNEEKFDQPIFEQIPTILGSIDDDHEPA